MVGPILGILVLVGLLSGIISGDLRPKFPDKEVNLSELQGTYGNINKNNPGNLEQRQKISYIGLESDNIRFNTFEEKVYYFYPDLHKYKDKK